VDEPGGRMNSEFMPEPHRVFLVLDRNYGPALIALSEKGPVWIVDTPENRKVAQQIWKANSEASHLEGVTTFKFVESSSSDDMLTNEFETIDLHHGSYSADPPYTVLEVIGARLTEKVKAELARFGFNQFIETADGFRALRSMDP